MLVIFPSANCSLPDCSTLPWFASSLSRSDPATMHAWHYRSQIASHMSNWGEEDRSNWASFFFGEVEMSREVGWDRRLLCLLLTLRSIITTWLLALKSRTSYFCPASQLISAARQVEDTHEWWRCPFPSPFPSKHWKTPTPMARIPQN